VPHLEDRVRPLSDVIDVDLVVPGCPPCAIKQRSSSGFPTSNCLFMKSIASPSGGFSLGHTSHKFVFGSSTSSPLSSAMTASATTSDFGGHPGTTTRVIDQGAKMISAIASDFGVERDKKVDPEEVAEQLDDILGTFYTYTLPAALIPMKIQKEGK